VTQSDGDWEDHGDIEVLIEHPPLTHKSRALAYEYGWYVSETDRGGPTLETESKVSVCQASMGTC
jgi:hypothetical protein